MRNQNANQITTDIKWSDVLQEKQEQHTNNNVRNKKCLRFLTNTANENSRNYITAGKGFGKQMLFPMATCSLLCHCLQHILGFHFTTC